MDVGVWEGGRSFLPGFLSDQRQATAGEKVSLGSRPAGHGKWVACVTPPPSRQRTFCLAEHLVDSSPSRTVPKRPATLADRSIVSPVSESPPTKKSPHALPPARREPCASCGLPVFIAERLIVGGRTLYHHSCFRCARCQHQLSLANCYETEDGRYCCETCPDEVGSSVQFAKEAVDSPVLGGDALSVGSENDEYSATFDLAMEAPTTPDASSRVEQVSSSSLARSNFMNSQLLLSEPDVSSLDESLSSYSRNLVSKKPGATEAVRVGDESVANLQTDQDERHDDAVGMLAPTYADTDASATSLTSSVSVRSSDSVDKNTASGELSPPVMHAKESVSSPSSLSIVQMRLKMFEKSSVIEPQKEFKETTISSNRQSPKVIKNIVPEKVSTKDDTVNTDSPSDELPTNFDQTSEITLPEHDKIVIDSVKATLLDPKIEKPVGNDDRYNISKSPHSYVDATDDNLHDTSVEKELCSLQTNVDEKHAQENVTLDHVKGPSVICTESGQLKIEDAGKSLYPVELNPFGEDDDGDVGGGNPEVVVTEAVNPGLKMAGKPPLPATRRVVEAPKQSLNPFWSDGEEPDSDEELEHRKTPVPCPRKSKTVATEVQREPSPLPRSIGVKVGSITSLSSIGSSASSTPFGTAQRKKKLAPPPPSARELFSKSAESSRTSSPTPSSLQSPQVVRRHRKSRQAPLPPSSNAPQWNHNKDDKNAANRIKQNGVEGNEEARPVVAPNKSVAGQWKRKKGPAPPRPVPQRRQIRAMPMKEVRQELEDIEVQQLGLERQGVKLEQTIRALLDNNQDQDPDPLPSVDVADPNIIPDVEDLVLQLFELVNEKNELFRRQAELMYLRRQQRLEEEHADLEYQIRCLLERPDHAKTDSDKAREEELIQRLVEVVERRNEIVECLEMDRRREVEEDRSIHHQLGIFAAKKKVGEEVVLVPSKEQDKSSGQKGKEEKKKHKKIKEKLAKKKLQEKVDVDKDIDEVEQSLSRQNKEKKVSMIKRILL
ncbi:MICAL-like protein 1 isoform X2 [Bacillus rossius redtenbacheri]|uniref:MICAL-like protein 1 isoform X2 n=1 Tax=Bacillus rossius redtenbacheri TaxID=93214 RepID=UPI002FDD5A30